MQLFVPSAIAIAAAYAAGSVQHWVRPRWATWVLTVLTAGAATAFVWSVGVMALAFAVQRPQVANSFGWCSTLLGSHDRVPVPLGLMAWLALAAMAALAFRRIRTQRRAMTGDGPEILDSNTPLAFAVPGRHARVVVSTGMLEALDEREVNVLFAHERSHLAHNHHRFLAIAEAAGAAVPIMRPLSDRVRLATERWADEDAAAEIGDRHVVAKAIAHAALAASGAPRPALSFSANHTVTRVAAMMQPAPAGALPVLPWLVVGGAGVAVALSGSAVQLHHLVGFVRHVCGVG